MPYPGPPELGRGVVVGPGAEPPGPWASSPRVAVGAEQLTDPSSVLAELHSAWAARVPLVIELAVDAAQLRVPQYFSGAVYELDPGFGFAVERLQFLVWANTYDARHGEPIWWHGRKAARRWAASRCHRGRHCRRRGPGRPAVVHRRGTPGPAEGRLGHRRRPPVERRVGDARPDREPGRRRPTWPRTSSQRWARVRPGPGDRPGRLGQDPGPHRATAAPRRRPRRPSGRHHGCWPTTPGPPRRCRQRCADFLTSRRTAHPHPEQSRTPDL